MGEEKRNAREDVDGGEISAYVLESHDLLMPGSVLVELGLDLHVNRLLPGRGQGGEGRRDGKDGGSHVELLLASGVESNKMRWRVEISMLTQGR